MRINPKGMFAFGSHMSAAACMALLTASSIAAPAVAPRRMNWGGARWQNAGPSQASNTIASLPQSRVIYWDKRFRKNLKTNTAIWRCAAPVDLPLHSGNTIDLFMYQTLPANTAFQSDGTVGSGITVSVSSTLATVGELGDYCNFSSFALAAAIDPTVGNISTEMSYRNALSLSIIARNVADGLTSIDASVAISLAASSTTVFTVNSIGQIRAAIQSLAGRSVPPPEGEDAFCGAIHPFTWGDALNDTSNNSAVDILKRTESGQKKLEALPTVNLEEPVELPGTGVRFYPTNLVTQTTNYKSITGLTALRAYIFGYDGLLRVSMKAPGDTEIGDGDWRGIKTYMRQNLEPSSFDPTGTIGGFCSYIEHIAVSPPPDTVMRVRYIDAASGIS